MFHHQVFNNFAEYSTKENLIKIENELSEWDNNKIENFQTYILIPLVMKLGDTSSTTRNDSELNTEIIKFLKKVIHKIYIKDINALKTIVIVILHKISSNETGHLKKDSSEEIKLAAVECIAESFQRSTLEVLKKIYQQEYCSIIGKICIICVDLIQNEKYRNLQIAAIVCLQSVFFVHDSADSSNIAFRNQVADSVFLFLPKIVLVLFNIAIGDDKQGQLLISKSIQALGSILCLIFEDSNSNIHHQYLPHDFLDLIENDNAITSPTKARTDEILESKILQKYSEENFKTLQNNGRNASWLHASSKKLKPILSKMLILCSNSSIHIQHEYSKMVCELALKCTTNLRENFNTFFEAIIILSEKDDSKTQVLCKNTIENLNNSESDIDINAILEDLFNSHIIKLPRIIYRCEESEQMAALLFFKGFLNVIPNINLFMILTVAGNLEKLTNCLIILCDFDLKQNLLQEEYSLRKIDEDHCSREYKKFEWRNFKNISSNEIEVIVYDICKILGKSSIVNLIFDRLIDILSKNTTIYNECVFILMLILTSDEQNNDLLSNYLTEILKETHWHLALQADQSKNSNSQKNCSWYIDRTPGLYESAIEIRKWDIDENHDDRDADFVNISDVQFNVLHTCILLDCLGHVALSLKENFKPFIFRSLHKILLKTGSSNYLIHKSGSFALNSIKNALGFCKISELIEQFSDYISYHINISLRKINNEDSRSAVDILSTVLRYSSLQSISHLENIIDSIIIELTRKEQSSNLTSYLKVFDMILFSIDKWSSKPSYDEIKCNDYEQPAMKYFSVFEECFKILNKPLEEADDDIRIVDVNSQSSIENSKESDENKEDSSEPELPAHLQIVKKILNQVLKSISSKNQMQKIVALECFINGLPILIDYENELLPMVHLLWFPFIERFKDDDSIVLYRCFLLLKVLAECAKDFVLRNTLKDIVPFLNNFLKRSSIQSSQNFNLTNTQEFKLQLLLLQEYGKLIINIDIKNDALDEISDVIVLYLNKNQPEILQQTAVRYFETISSYNRPLIYVKLIYHMKNVNLEGNVKRIFNSFYKKID